MDEHLKEYLGVEKVIWVKEGIDPEETNGHIDDVATFIAPGVMACIWTDDPEYPFYEQCHAAYETLSNAVDAKGRKMKVYKPLHAREPAVHGSGFLRHHRRRRERRAARPLTSR